MRSLRLGAAVGCVLLSAWLGHLSTRFALTRPAGIRAALADPAGFDGSEITLLLWRVQESRSLESIVVENRGRTVTVHTSGRALARGAEVTIRGRFTAADSSVEASHITVHHLRNVKRALGLLGMVLAVALLHLGFRVHDGWLEERG